ncbi:MAG TPA: TolC family protein [Gemmataceae bacterium]|jgi:cobalt-zinc-cadmium efflux system outer membrane protein
MSRARRLLLVCLLLSGGCRGGPVVQQTDRILLEMASHPFDVAPPQSNRGKPTAEASPPANTSRKPAKAGSCEPETDLHTVAFLQAEKQVRALPEYELKIPPGLPGSDAPPLPDLRRLSPEERLRTIQKLYPELPPLAPEPTPEPGPNGTPFTLADLQKLAVENSPILRQAVSDVKEAEGRLVQAKTYSNPTIAPFYLQPNNNNAAAGAPGVFLDQPISTFGKKKMQVAVAQKQLDNAELALKRARFDLTTNVRNAYFALIVAKETLRVNVALVYFTDEIYRLYTGYLAAGVIAEFEPAPLRAQAWSNRLIYKQAINNYVYAWMQLVAAIGLPQLPLTDVAGSIDRLIPYYDYDKVQGYILNNHTDVLTARNGVLIAQYNLKLAQITPFGDFDLQYGINKEVTVAPFAYYNTFMVGMPLPIFDQNRGNIKAAQAQLIRAVEESHRVENALTGSLATSYANYKNNLFGLEYYRRYILPDQMTYYRGMFLRRQADPTASPADLVTAQQALTLNVQNYLGILGTLWSSVVSVADLIQTPDLFQMAQPHELPAMPKLDQVPHWLCPHHRVAAAPASMMDCNCAPPVAPVVKLPAATTETHTPTQPVEIEPVLPTPRRSEKPSTLPPPDQQHKQVKHPDLTQELLEPPPEIPRKMKRNEEGESPIH